MTEGLAWVNHWLNCGKWTINEQVCQWRDVWSEVLQVFLLLSVLFNKFGKQQSLIILNKLRNTFRLTGTSSWERNPLRITKAEAIPGSGSAARCKQLENSKVHFLCSYASTVICLGPLWKTQHWSRLIFGLNPNGCSKFKCFIKSKPENSYKNLQTPLKRNETMYTAKSFSYPLPHSCMLNLLILRTKISQFYRLFIKAMVVSQIFQGIIWNCQSKVLEKNTTPNKNLCHGEHK